MYLYYYCNEKYVGTVDIEVFMSMQQKKALITCTPEAEDLIASLELMYGKRILHFTPSEALDLKRGIRIAYKDASLSGIPSHVFLTKKMGKKLQWSEWGSTLCG